MAEVVLTAVAVAAAPMAVAALVSEASMAVRVDTTGALDPTVAIAVSNGQDTKAAADMDEWAEKCHRRAVPARPGVRLHCLGPTLRRDGTRLDDPRAATKLPVGASKWPEPMGHGTPSVAPALPVESRQQPPGSGATASSRMAEPLAARAGVEEIGAAEAGADGVAAGDTLVMDLAGDAGPAAGDSALDGELAGIPTGPCIPILIGTTSGGAIPTATMLRLTTFILTLLKVRGVGLR